jgi:hypothetical protein
MHGIANSKFCSTLNGFYSPQKHGLFRTKKKSIFKFGTPERKILITLCYYVLMSVVALTRFTFIVRNAEAFEGRLTDYFACEAGGKNPDCDRNDFRQHTNPTLSAMSLALIGLFPAVNLIYAINVGELKEKCCCRRTEGKKMTSTGLSSSKLAPDHLQKS